MATTSANFSIFDIASQLHSTLTMVVASDENYSNLASWRQHPIKVSKTKVKSKNGFKHVLKVDDIKDPNLLWVTKYHLSKLGLEQHRTVTKRMIVDRSKYMLVNMNRNTGQRVVRKVHQAHCYLLKLLESKDIYKVNLKISTTHAKEPAFRRKRVRFVEPMKPNKSVMFPCLVEAVPRPDISDFRLAYQDVQASRRTLQLGRIREPTVKRLALLSLSALELVDSNINRDEVTIEEIEHARDEMVWKLHPLRKPLSQSRWTDSHRQSIYLAYNYLIVLLHRQVVVEHVSCLVSC